MCTYGNQCTRPSCFFAHSMDELRVPWKGNTGSTSGGDQQQQQQKPQQQHQAAVRVLAIEVEAPPAGLLNLNRESTSQGMDVMSDATGSLNMTVGGHAAASTVSMVGGGGGGMIMAGGGSCGGSVSGRQLLMIHPVNVQQQLQGAMPARVAGGGSGSGSHSVVDVRVITGARAAAAAMAKPIVPVIVGGEQSAPQGLRGSDARN